MEGFLKEILAKLHSTSDEWQTEMQLNPCAPALSTFTPVAYRSKSELEVTGVHIVESLDEFVGKSVKDGKGRCIAIVPENPYFVTIYRLKRHS
jgi:hypothetical protein